MAKCGKIYPKSSQFMGGQIGKNPVEEQYFFRLVFCIMQKVILFCTIQKCLGTIPKNVQILYFSAGNNNTKNIARYFVLYKTFF